MKEEHENKSLKTPENKDSKKPYVFCEPSFSKVPGGNTHIRQTTGVRRLGADSAALCGAEVLWDLANKINPYSLGKKNVCQLCLEKFYNETLGNGDSS